MRLQYVNTNLFLHTLYGGNAQLRGKRISFIKPMKNNFFFKFWIWVISIDPNLDIKHFYVWILSFDHVFTSHNIFVNSKRTYTSTRDSQGTPTDYIFQIEGLTQMHDYDDDLLYKNVILLTTCIFYWHMMKVGLEAPLYRGAGRKNLRGGGEVLFVSSPFCSVIFTSMWIVS